MKFPLNLIPKEPNIKFSKILTFGFGFGLLLIVLSIFAIANKGINFGIDFTGGIVMEVKHDQQIEIKNWREVLLKSGFPGASLQYFGSNDEIMIRLRVPENQDQQVIIDKARQVLEQNFGNNLDYRKTDFVGPQVSETLTENAYTALILSLLAMMLYLWFRFDWYYSVGGLVALLHDAIITIGFFAITGIQFDLASVAAILAIIGYSINDSVVIYDRIRENLRKYKKKSIYKILDKSINQNLSRTLLTSITTLLATLALIVFGGEVIRGFSIAIFFGIVIGTFSSIFIAAPLLPYLGIRQALDVRN